MASRQEILEGMRVHDKAMPPESEIIRGVVVRPGDLYDPQTAQIPLVIETPAPAPAPAPIAPGTSSGLRSKQLFILQRRPREDDEYVLRIVNARGGQRSIEPTPEQRRVAHLRYIEEYDSDAERRMAAGRKADMIEDLSAML
jgi:hypothetical protein